MGKPTLESMSRSIEEIQASIKKLEEDNEYLRDVIKEMSNPRKGVKSTRPMNREDAVRVVLGDMKDYSTKEAAQKLGLSYGQIYSARGGYTFADVFDETLKKK